MDLFLGMISMVVFARRGFKATIVRTLTRPEITGRPACVIQSGEPVEVDDD
jgi:hypothetical protein